MAHFGEEKKMKPVVTACSNTGGSMHLQCAMPSCRNCQGARIKDKLFNETQELFNRRRYLDAMTIGPDDNGILHGFTEFVPKITMDVTTHVATDLKLHRKEACRSTQTPKLSEAIHYCPSTITDRNDDVSRARILNLELLQRKVAREDMKMFRMELVEVIAEERIARRELNARNKMMYTVLTQCLKMIDLWEEGCWTMDTINEKNVFIAKKKDKMEEKIAKRLGLEQDNKCLRASIAELQDKLQNTRAQNISRDGRHGKLSGENRDETTRNKGLNSAVSKARNGQVVLQSAMATAEVSLAEAFKPFEDADDGSL